MACPRQRCALSCCGGERLIGPMQGALRGMPSGPGRCGGEGGKRRGEDGLGEGRGLFAAVFFADEDGFEEAEEDVGYGFCGGHRVCCVCW